MEQIFIDRFTMPENALPEFTERMEFNRNFLRTLPGFIRDDAYESRDDQGNILCITVAVWESTAAVHNAKEQVEAEYKKINFDMPAMLERLDIRMERGLYRRLGLL